MSAYNYFKISLLNAYIYAQNFDIICLFETHVTSYTNINDGNLAIQEYIMYCIYHPSDAKRGEIYIYYQTMMPLKVLLTNYLQKCINFEVTIRNKVCQLTDLYRSPNQSQDEFHYFLTNLQSFTKYLRQTLVFM